MQIDITLRPQTPADEEFLCRLYASTRNDEFAAVPWPEEAKQAFLADQYRLQTRHYTTYYPAADFLLIEHEQQRLGRLYLYRSPGELCLMDIALLPEWRGRGIGSKLLGEVLETARLEGRKVTCHVEFNNPALRLYQRLGFELIEKREIYLYMECRPA